MRALSAAELLSAWERGLDQPPVQRGLALLAAACPDVPPDVLASLSVGQREARLLALREWTFGPQMVGLVICPGCGERLELVFNVADIRVTPQIEPVAELSVSVAGYEVRFRLPGSLDLAAIAGHEDVSGARLLVLGRCLIGASDNGEATSAARLPAEVVDAVAERMARADPQADIELALSCASCGHQWGAVIDVLSFFWAEISAWAHRLLREVHALASAYGWREADILAMSPRRRQFYLEMAGR